MTRYLTHNAQQVEHRWLSPLLLSIFAAGSLIATIDSASLAEAAGCLVTQDENGTAQGLTAWKSSASSIRPFSNNVERDIYGLFAPSPVRASAPYISHSRLTWGNRENLEIATTDACLSQDIRKSALFNRAMITSIGKTRAKVSTKTMKVFALLYYGKRQVHTTRTILPEIETSAREKIPTIIGPVQEILKSNLSDERSVSQIVATLPPTVESFSLLGGQPFVVVNPIQNALPLPDNESLLMNRATTQALHEGNYCGSGCP